MMKTAVEWLVEEISREDWWYLPMVMKLEIIQQAKEMEKQQIIDAYETSHISMMTSEQYYNEKFKK